MQMTHDCNVIYLLAIKRRRNTLSYIYLEHSKTIFALINEYILETLYAYITLPTRLEVMTKRGTTSVGGWLCGGDGD